MVAIKQLFVSLRAAFAGINGIVRNSLIGGASTFVAQSLLLVASIVLTRLYNPDDFGLLALYSAILGIIGVVANLRYERAIPLPSSNIVAANVLAVSLGSVIVMSALSAAVAWILTSSIDQTIDNTLIVGYLTWVPVGVLLLGTYQALSYWAIRERSFGLLGTTKIMQAISTICTQVALGVLIKGPVGLIGGQIAGQGVGIGALTRLVLRTAPFKSISFKGAIGALKEFKQFPMYSSWSGLAMMLANQLPVFVLTFFFGAIETGLYALGNRIIRTPIIMLGNAISQAYFADVAKAFNDGSLGQLTMSISRQLMKVAVAISILALLAAPEIVRFLFGSEWSPAGLYIQVLTPWLLMQLMSAPVPAVAAVLGKQRYEMILGVFLLFGRTSMLVIGGVLDSPVLAVGLDALITAIGLFVLLLKVYTSLSITSSEIVSTLLRPVARVILLCGPAIIGKIASYTASHDLFTILGATLSALLVLGDMISGWFKHKRAAPGKA